VSFVSRPEARRTGGESWTWAADGASAAHIQQIDVLGDGADTAERAGRVVLKPPTRDGSLSGKRRMILAGPTSGERASEADAAAAAAIIFFGGVLDAFSNRKGRRRVVVVSR
jgi:hypothetical protein